MKKSREGYKMSELGEIPSDWEIISLESLGEFKNGINKGKDDFGFGVKFVNIQDAYIGNLIVESRLGRLNVNEKEKEIYKLINGDIVVVRSSVKPEGVGYPILFDGAQEDVVYCGFMIRYRYNIDKVNPLFMLYQLRSSKARKQVLDLSTVSANTNINQESYKKVKIILPTKKEQEKIASILSTVDEQIDNVDALIEKNKELKKGLMQTLLTKGIGHTKFKKTEIGEIPEEWEIKELSELYSENIRDFGSFSTTKLIEYVEEGIPYLRAENFRENKIVLNSVSYITEEVDKLLDKSYVYDGNILFTKIGNIGCATVYRGELGTRCNSNATIAKIKIDENIYDSNYIVYFLNSLQCKKQYIGSIISTPPRINMGEISKFKIAIPKLYEQTKIASILLKVDSKIEEYENKKNMFEELKKGLMQQLLTGKTRIC